MIEKEEMEEGFVKSVREMPLHLQAKAKRLCCAYNLTTPEQPEERARILQELLGTCHPQTKIEPSFHCDYGFNIHTHGLTVINYNCVILDTSKVSIGKNAFIAPGVCLSCAAHPILAEQRSQGILLSKPITLEDNVWIGANTTVCGGVTIGEGSVIGAGSVVLHDIPKGVVAAGNPCRVIRKITKEDWVSISS